MEQTGASLVVERVRHELKLRAVRVASIAPIGDGFLSITFQGESLRDFASLAFDDHVKFIFEDGGEQVKRDYTPRHADPARGELTIEFALHGDGKAARWARSAQVGQEAAIGGPKGSQLVRSVLDWQLMAGDATALPAISRRIDELPGTTRAIVLVAADASERRAFPRSAGVEVHWFDGGDQLIAALDALALPAGTGFAWGAGEAGLMARVRAALDGKGVARAATRVSAYWKRGVSAHHASVP